MKRTIYLLVKIDGDSISYGEISDNDSAHSLKVVAGLMCELRTPDDVGRLIKAYQHESDVVLKA